MYLVAAEEKSNTVVIAMGVSIALLVLVSALLVIVLVTILLKKNRKLKGTLSAKHKRSSDLKDKSSPNDSIQVDTGTRDVYEVIPAGQTGPIEVCETGQNFDLKVYEKPGVVTEEYEKPYTGLQTNS